MEIPMLLDIVHYLALVLEIVAIQHQRVTLIFKLFGSLLSLLPNQRKPVY